MLKLFGSVKLTISLLVLLVLASIVGTLIPQTWTESQYKDRYGDSRYAFMKNLQLVDVYHSYWYVALLAALCVNLCMCSLQNFGPLMKSLSQSSSRADRVKLSDLPYHEEIRLGEKGAGSGKVIEKVKDVLSGSLYRVKYEDAESGLYYFERGKLGRFGPLMTHASVIIILIGGIVVATFGFKDYRNIPVGETIDVPHADFQLRVDDFQVEFYPDQSPKEFISVLTVIENGVEKLTRSIEVNKPLKYKGINFYQSNYGLLGGSHSMGHVIQVELSKKTPDKSRMEVIGKFDVDIRKPFQVPDSQLKIKVLNLVPDFVIDGDKHVSSRSDKPNNPAALLELYEDDKPEPIYRSWSFLKIDFHGSGESDYALKFVGMTADSGTKPRYYTGLQIRSHPGLPIIWAGCLIMVVGMFLSFYLSFKRIWVRIADGNLEMGGRSYKDRAGFEREFGKLKSALE